MWYKMWYKIPVMPKSHGKHKHHKLTDAKVRKLTKSGRYSDGLCLYLIVTATGSKQWVLRVIVNGQRKDMGLGGYPTITLAEARKKAMEYRRLAKQGKNPIEIRRKSQRTIPTFEDDLPLLGGPPFKLEFGGYGPPCWVDRNEV